MDGSITRDKDYELLWDRCNVVVKSWIMHNVSRDLISEIWDDLRETRLQHLHYTGRFLLSQNLDTEGPMG